MSDSVLIPLPGIGTLSLTREQYKAALIPNAPVEAQHGRPTAESLINAKSLAAALCLPVSCIYEYAKTGRIPSVRVGRHVRFNQSQVLAALKTPGTATVGHV
jgi:excisionase family DNA binding protein